jgi:hypothetical protein|nr:MAG TPA: head-tail joining protein [Caudoviricetes sp.]
MRGERVTVLKPAVDSIDPFGNPVKNWDEEQVDNVLVDPYVSLEKVREFGAERPNSSRTTVRFHFPKGYEDQLRGCFICWRGRKYRVIGDPVPLPEYNTPGEWNYPVDAEVCDG